MKDKSLEHHYAMSDGNHSLDWGRGPGNIEECKSTSGTRSNLHSSLLPHLLNMQLVLGTSL